MRVRIANNSLREAHFASNRESKSKQKGKGSEKFFLKKILKCKVLELDYGKYPFKTILGGKKAVNLMKFTA